MARWILTVLYLLSAGLCLAVAIRERRARKLHAPTGPRPLFWFLVFGIMAVLAEAGQLRSQWFLTGSIRTLFKDLGVYQFRRPVQLLFIVVVAAVGITLALEIINARQLWRRHAFALLGIIYVVGFIAIRLASFHYVDVIVHREIGYGIGISAMAELMGPLLVSMGAIRALRDQFNRRSCRCNMKMSR